VTADSHESNKLFCDNCKQNRDVDHLCFIRPLKDVLPSAGDKVIYVFYDFDTIQNTKYSDKATLQYLISSECKSSVRISKTWKASETACDGARGTTRSGTIR